MANLKDFATGTVLSAPSPATSGTQLTLQSGEGALFPTPPFYATAHPDYQLPTLSNAEKILVTNITTNTLTFTRAQGDSTAKSIAIGWRISNAVFKDDLFNQSLVTGETPGGTINGSNTAFTVAAAFTTGSLRVFLNGQRLKSGSGNDYTEDASLTGFTMLYAPATGDVLMVDYNIGSTAISYGVNSTISDETPTGLVNGSNTSFTTLRAYVAGTLEVYINGLKQARTLHVTESSPTAGTFTLDTAPATGDVVRTNYQYAVSAGGNADTVDGYNATELGDTNGQLIVDYLGWRKFAVTLTYASATTFTLPGDYTGILSKGTKLWLTQTTSKYFYVVGLSFATGTTTVTITGGSDYTLANAAITAPYFSFDSNPANFPQYFNYTGAWGAVSAPAIGNGTIARRFTINQRTVIVSFYILYGTTTTSGSGDFSFGLPVTVASSGVPYVGSSWGLDGGVAYYGGVAKCEPGASVAQCFSSASSGLAWSATMPITWGNTDRLALTLSYEI